MMKKALSYLGLCLLLVACNRNSKLFERLDSKHTGIHFRNTITENDSVNILDMEYVYNGGGIAVGDFNNDSLQDMFFTGNMVANKLYLNKGEMQFEDVTKSAGIDSIDRWYTGVASVDINRDGKLDLYVCASIKSDPSKRKNLLYINQGNNKDGVPQFREDASSYGIADTTYSTNAAFFDYDNDGDLDLYVLVNKMPGKKTYPNQYRKVITDGSAENTDRLYRNDWNASLNHPVFTDVSKEAGISIEGYGLGLNISDINRDGWKDIYVTNDFLSNDHLYINNKNGTFTDRLKEYLKHSSYSAMGNDISDINNDGLSEIIAVDMLPETNYRKKMMMPANSYSNYINNDEYGYLHQYGRNTLQLNLGNISNQVDSLKHPVFGDIAFHAGIAETDWSWTPLVVDFDNDGYRDIIITNGFPKDITDHDFMNYRVNASNIAKKEEVLEQIPEVKLTNYAYRNNGDLSFTNVIKDWGMEEPNFSTGAVYADFDNDGDMDWVVSTFNDEPFIYRNTSSDNKEANHHFLQVKFKGDDLNPDGVGAIVELYQGNQKQVYENSPYRGYLSTVQLMAHFGLGANPRVDSIRFIWRGNRSELLKNIAADQVLIADIRNAKDSYLPPANINLPLFSDVTSQAGINYMHTEYDFADFNIQRLLPHKLSEYGPAIAVGDIDGNGTDDFITGGSYGYSANLFFQNANGSFVQQELIAGADPKTKSTEDLGLLLFDADGDTDLDLYIASGSYENEPNSVFYRDHFFVNDGKGNFSIDTLALPANNVSKSCVRAADFDHDGDLDLFVAGRVEPWHYPKPVSSFIYRNDSKNGVPRFTDVTATLAKDLQNLGLVCDAVWTDFDNDGWEDLLIAGEWMPLVFIKNDKGKFVNKSSLTGISSEKGWWNSIAPGDFDNDGDIDYIVANLGTNSFYRASKEYPARIYANDFDNNGSYDAMATIYLMDEEGGRKEYPAQTRDDLIKQMIGVRARFQKYSLFANATMDKVLTADEIKNALVLQANNLESAILINDGKGNFKLQSLPTLAQITALNGMVTADFNADGNLDVLVNANDYGTEVSVGRYDALNGLLLLGDGKGSFSPVLSEASGIFIRGNGKGLAGLRSAPGGYAIAAGQNRGKLILYKSNQAMRCLPVNAGDAFAEINLKNGKTYKQELYYGSGFLSQSGRFITVPEATVESISVTDNKGNRRNLAL